MSKLFSPTFLSFLVVFPELQDMWEELLVYFVTIVTSIWSDLIHKGES